MSDIDSQIRDALSAEDQAALNAIKDEAGLFELVGMSFRSKNAWLTWIIWIAGFVVFVLGLYFLGLFLDSTDLKTSLGWALAIIACMLTISLIKVFAWQQLFKLELMREIKRLELRLLSLK